MAASRSKVPAIGSARWILEERHQSNDLVAQELEDFGFSVRNELEWLNEHMADIFAKDGQYVAHHTRREFVADSMIDTTWMSSRLLGSCAARRLTQRAREP